MDTRRKILSWEEALSLPPGRLIVVTSTFNPLVAAHVRAITAVRRRTAGHPVLVVVTPAEPELLPARARAEVAAGLRMVDYVLTADHEQTGKLIGVLAPSSWLRLEADDAVRTGQLIDHVRRRQNG